MKRYYVKFYPERLPQLLLFRLQSKFGRLETGLPHNLLIIFLDIDRQFIRNHRDRYLLKMLDDFTIAGYRFTDIVILLERPEKFIESLLKDPDKRDVLDEAIQELSLFLEFCLKLNEILIRAQSWPLLQSEIWLRYSYWFEIIGEKLDYYLGSALDKFLSWNQHPDDQVHSEVKDYVNRMRGILKQLISANYATLVDKMLKDLRKQCDS